MNRMTLAVDHLAWQPQPGGYRRVVRSGAGIWSVTLDDGHLGITCVSGGRDREPRLTRTCPTELPAAVPAALTSALQGLGVVHRLPNPWLWDAITTAVLRQVVRAAQARRLYQRWCETHGHRVNTDHGELVTAPDPQTVLSLTDSELATAGAAFHAGALRAAAAAYLEHHDVWETATPQDLVQALLTVPRIGPWTARAAAADYTGDFSIYPHDDLAVRTWARHAAPDVAWPSSARSFERTWTSLTTTTQELHTLTALTLTWGNHAPITHEPHPTPAPP
jgi:hypothetical protein